jgi:tetratricopeptide (TPR) repeat protein
MGSRRSKRSARVKASPSQESRGPHRPKESTRSTLLLVLVLAATTALTYSNAFSSPFVMDDQSAVTDNLTIRSLRPLARVLSGPIQSSTAGRPLINLSFAVNYAADGLNTTGYHAVNLLLHILAGLTLFGIVRRTLVNASQRPDLQNLSKFADLFAFSCALIWLLHPLQSEMVDYVTQRTESSMGLAYLLTLYAFIRGTTSDRRPLWYSLAIASCLLGALCKESIVTAPVMVFLYDAVFCSESFLEPLRRRGALYAGLAASWIVVALVAGGARSHSAGFSSGVSPWTYLLNQAPLLVRYLKMTVWPTHLVADYGLPRTVGLGSVLPAGLLIVALLVATTALWFFNRPAAFLGTWFFVTLAPTSSFVPIATEVGAERRMYLALAAIVALAIAALMTISSDRRLIAPIVASVALFLAIVTFHRNSDYRDPTALWLQVIDRYPHGRAHYNYGVRLKDAGRRDDAIHEYLIAAPDFPEAEYALGFEFLNDERYDEAAARLRRFLQLKPLDIDAIRASNLLGRSLLASGHPDDALVSYRDTLRMQPRNADAMSGIGESLLKLGRLQEAVDAFRASLQQAADNPSVHYNLGFTLMNLGRFDDASEALANAVRLEPKNPAYHGNLATSLAQLGKLDEAVEQFRQALALEADPSARKELEGLIAQISAEKKRAGQH